MRPAIVSVLLLCCSCGGNLGATTGGEGGGTTSTTSDGGGGAGGHGGGTTTGGGCASAMCDVNATCTEANGAATCTCNQGYSGDGKTCMLNSVPTGQGWIRVAGTKFTPVCQAVQGAFGFDQDCRSIFTAWSGGVADSTRNRLVIWGGGHNDYYGNEVYTFDLGTMGYQRLNAPTPLAEKTDCIKALPDGRPTSRHTYGGLAYMANVDRMVMFGGAPSCPTGGITDDAWELDFQGLAADPDHGAYWTQVIPTVPGLAYGGILGASDYDPVSKLVYLYTAGGQLLTYDAATKSTTIVAEPNVGGYHHTAVVAPEARALFMAGDNMLGTLSLEGSHAYEDLSPALAACAPLGAAAYPGLAYDPAHKTIVGWAGGNTVYSIDLAKKSCTVLDVPGDAPGAQIQNGTNGRFRYFATLGGFVLANDPDDDVRLLKLD